MRKRLYMALILGTILFSGSCKKDLLHWQQVQRLTSNSTDRLNHIRFMNDSVCLIAGGEIYNRAAVLRSADGGYTWTANSYPQAGKAMFGMGVSPEGSVYLCGVDGTVLHSKDNGVSWQFGRINDWQHYVGASFISPDTGIFVSTVLQRQGTITQVDSNFNIIDAHTFLFGINDIYMTSPSTGYVIGYGTVLKTTDYRKTWNFLNVNGDNFTAMDIHGNEMWLCGYNGGVYHTADAGNSWTTYRDGNDFTKPRYHILDIVFNNYQKGWAVCDDGRMIYSDDGGRHWMEYDRFTTSALRSIAICPNGDLLAAGDDGAIFRLTP